MDQVEPRTDIIFIRHAKTKPIAVGQEDFDRGLKHPRARKDIRGVSETFVEQYSTLKSNVLCSPSKRTRETLDLLVNSGLMYADRVRFPEGLYLASADEIEAIMVNHFLKHRPKRLFIIGHNPGLAYIASRIPLLKFDHLPTSGLVYITHPQDANSWDWSEVKLKCFLYPKLLRS